MTVTVTQATLSPTPRIRNAGHPFSMLPVRTSKFCPRIRPGRRWAGKSWPPLRADGSRPPDACWPARRAGPAGGASLLDRGEVGHDLLQLRSVMSSAYSGFRWWRRAGTWMSGARAARSRPGLMILRVSRGATPYPGDLRQLRSSASRSTTLLQLVQLLLQLEGKRGELV